MNRLAERLRGKITDAEPRPLYHALNMSANGHGMMNVYMHAVVLASDRVIVSTMHTHLHRSAMTSAYAAAPRHRRTASDRPRCENL